MNVPIIIIVIIIMIIISSSSILILAKFCPKSLDMICEPLIRNLANECQQNRYIADKHNNIVRECKKIKKDEIWPGRQ